MDEEKKKMVVDIFKAASKPKKINNKPPSQKSNIRIEHCQGHIVGQQFTVHHYDPEQCRGCRTDRRRLDRRRKQFSMQAVALSIVGAVLLSQILWRIDESVLIMAVVGAALLVWASWSLRAADEDAGEPIQQTNHTVP